MAAALVALVTVPIGVNLMWEPLTGRNLPLAGALGEALSPLLIVNSYGPFATTTTTRPEIVIEGSDDGRTWREYALPYKPGPVGRPLKWSIPLQPRLDWQLWFAAYGGAAENRWIERLLLRLLEGSPPVLGLLASNPFPDRPPKHVRAELYDYRFAAPGQEAWWERRLDGVYFPQVGLDAFSKGPLKGPPAPVQPGLIPGPGQIGR
jgi:hypothetical protein